MGGFGPRHRAVITNLEVTPVSVPFERDETWAYGRRAGISNLVIEVTTDAGVTGIGEAVGWPTPEVAVAVLRSAAPVVVGRDPFAIEELMRFLFFERGWHFFRHTAGCAFAGLEMALWDIVAKTCRLPLHVLFGGAVRDAIPFLWHVPTGDIDAMVAAAREGVRRGFATLYVKIGFEPGGTVEEVQKIRDAVGPEPAIRVDANEAWTVGRALAAIRQLKDVSVECVEQPVNMYDHDALAEVSERAEVPIAANQTTWDEYSTLAVLERGSASVIVTDPHQLGGLARFKQMAAIAEIADVPIVKHSFGDLGISSYACAHVLASCVNTGFAHQTHCQLLADDIIDGGVPTFEGGTLAVPKKPGIGVELDPERVAKYAQLYASGTVFTAYETRNELPA
jgi:L-alanine-DL-glutamate epimerase-like enolase superfamily enzyme